MEKKTEEKMYTILGTFLLLGFVVGAIALANKAQDWDEDAKAQTAYELCGDLIKHDFGPDAGIHNYSINVISGEMTCEYNHPQFGVLQTGTSLVTNPVLGIVSQPN